MFTSGYKAMMSTFSFCVWEKLVNYEIAETAHGDKEKSRKRNVVKIETAFFGKSGPRKSNGRLMKSYILGISNY